MDNNDNNHLNSNAPEMCNQHEQIVILKLNDFNPVIVRGADGQNRYESMGKDKKEVFSHIGWDENEIIARDIAKGISPVAIHEEDFDEDEEEFNDGLTYSPNIPCQFEALIGESPRWEDVDNA